MSQPSPAPPSRPRRVPLRRRPAWAWLRLFRPVALLTGVGVALGAAFTLDNGSPAWHEALAVAIVMAGLLAAASAFNDAEDAEFDRDAHVWRPIPAGFVTVPQAQRAAAAWALAALIAAATLGWIPFLLALATVALAYLHSARLKPGNFAWIAWALAFALVPLWIAEGVDAFDRVLWWAFPVGMTAGLAMYLAVKLPDYERDDSDDAHNLLHWLTIDYAVPVAWGAVGAHIVMAVASANLESLRAEWIIPAASVAIVLALVMMGILFFGVTERRLVWQRWILSLAIVGMEIGWLGSIIP